MRNRPSGQIFFIKNCTLTNEIYFIVKRSGSDCRSIIHLINNKNRDNKSMYNQPQFKILYFLNKILAFYRRNLILLGINAKHKGGPERNQ